MGRSGYDENADYDQWGFIRWRGAVKSAIRGKRGQAFLKEAIAALDALPAKQLTESELRDSAGGVCFLGAVGVARGMDMSDLDPEDYTSVAHAFGISEALAREIVYENDEIFRREAPENRFARMRRWAEKWLQRPHPSDHARDDGEPDPERPA
jgi:hypothetical protein